MGFGRCRLKTGPQTGCRRPLTLYRIAGAETRQSRAQQIRPHLLHQKTLAPEQEEEGINLSRPLRHNRDGGDNLPLAARLRRRGSLPHPQIMMASDLPPTDPEEESYGFRKAVTKRCRQVVQPASIGTRVSSRLGTAAKRLPRRRYGNADGAIAVRDGNAHLDLSHLPAKVTIHEPLARHFHALHRLDPDPSVVSCPVSLDRATKMFCQTHSAPRRDGPSWLASKTLRSCAVG